MQPIQFQFGENTLGSINFRVPPSMKSKNPVVININAGDDTVKANFQKLLERGKGEIFSVDETGKFVKVEGFFAKRRARRDPQNQQRVKQAIEGIFSALETHLNEQKVLEHIKIHRYIVRVYLVQKGKLGA